MKPLQSLKDTSSYGNVHGSLRASHAGYQALHLFHWRGRGRVDCLNLLLALNTTLSDSKKATFAFAYIISIQLDIEELRCQSLCTIEEKSPADAIPSTCTDMGFDQMH